MMIDAGSGGTGAPAQGEKRLAALQDAGRRLREIPRPSAAPLRERWERAREGFVRGGGLEACLRARGEPFLVIRTIDGQPHGKCFWWPEALPPGDPAKPMIDLELAVEGLPEDAICQVRQSWDDGKTWYTLRREKGVTHLYVSRDPAQGPHLERLRIEADFPGTKRSTDPEFFPMLKIPR